MRMPETMSSYLPIGTLPPKPPVLVGHRNATKGAAENVPMPAAISEMVARLKNCRRLTPIASGSGGTHGVSPVSDSIGAKATPVRATTPSASASAAVRATGAATAGAAARASASRRSVSLLRAPAPRTSERRARVTNASAPSTTTTATPMTMAAVVLMRSLSLDSEVEEQAVLPRQNEVEPRSSEERPDEDQGCPEHDVHRHQRRRELTILRLVRRVLVDVRGEDQHDQTHAGDRHAGDHRVEHREQFLQAEEVPGRLRRVGRLVDVRVLQQRRVDPDREQEREQ